MILITKEGNLLNKFLFNDLKRFGVDRAIFYTPLARVIQAFAGVITIFF